MLSRSLRDLTDSVLRSAARLDLANRSVLIENLVMVYDIIRASERLLLEAAEVARSSGIDPFDAELAAFCERHLLEERHHAKWLAEDLLSAGALVTARPALRQVVEAVGAQFYLIHAGSPEALLSYMAVLEWNALPIADVEELEALHGKDLLRTIRLHAEADPAHGQELSKMLDAVPASRAPAVLDNGLRITELLLQALRHVELNAIEREMRGG